MLPEILAPAGSREALAAALKAGADAVYFGLDEGFNARARAANFPTQQLPEIVAEIHSARARAYLALNTLVFESELEVVEKIILAAARAGVDALIVQDPAVCLLARHLCPELELHASTQMTISSPESARLARGWGVTRVVLPRELSLTEIEKFTAQQPDLETEVFIAGALCMSWSGQCLSSEAWGGRSANRGQCAQACRHPYDLVVDGQTRDLGALAYLLSPQDLGGFSAIEELSRLGVHTLKIEGRQKDADYVFQAVRAVRAWRDQLPDDVKRARLRNLNLAYSRGLSEGFFYGSDHQTLVEGLTPRHKGLLLGTVERLTAREVTLTAATDLVPEAGMGVVFRGDRAVAQEEEQGGPIFAVAGQAPRWKLTFGQPGPNLRQVRVGDEVWVTGSPQLARERQARLETQRWPLDLTIFGEAGQPLRATASWQHGQAQTHSAEPLQSARAGGLAGDTLKEKLGAFGDSSFALRKLDHEQLEASLFLPVSQLKKMRVELRDQLQAQLQQLGRREVQQRPLPRATVTELPGPLVLEPLCRTPEQLEAVIEAGLSGVTLDWMELIGLNAAVARARAAGLTVGLATVRVQKPGEEAYDRRLLALQPDWLLARHWGAVAAYKGGRVHGDFSLNVTNSVTAALLIEAGLETVTAAHDLDQAQLENLLRAFPPSRLAVTVHHHISTFHTEHCVYSHLLSNGRDYRDCGRPCEKHQVDLADRKGVRHPVIVDVGCRNTVFNGAAQSCPALVPRLLELGVRRLRLEFVRETRQETLTVLSAYQELIAGRLEPHQVRARIGVHEQFGVSSGTMSVLS